MLKIFKSLKFWVPLTGLFVAALIFSVFSRGFQDVKFTTLSSQEAADEAMKYVNENLLTSDAKASMSGKTEKKSGLHCFKVSVGGQEFDSCVSLDGKLFFPQVIDLTKKPEKPEEKAAESIPKKEAVEVHLYTMSYCPYGNQAEEVMYPVQKLLGEKVKIEPHFVIYSNYQGGGPNYCLDKENKYCSMHGIDELKEDIRELCIYKYQPEKFWDYIISVNKKCNLQDIEICWEGVAKEEEIDTTMVKNCQKNEATDLLAKEVELNKKYNITGSPDLVINGVNYSGSRTAEGYKKGICAGFQTPPEECNQSLGDEAPAAGAGGCK